MSVIDDEAHTPIDVAYINAQIMKLMAETEEIHQRMWWYPVVIASGIMGGTAAIVGVVIKLLS